MKRCFLTLIGAIILNAVSAQVVEENEAALVYYSPRTTVVLDFTYTVEVREKGPFAEFAEPMLGANDAVMENSSSYVLNEVQIGTATTADYTRPHKLSADAGIPMLLSINNKGVLAGYNKQPESSRPAPDKKSKGREEPSHLSVAPFPEEVLNAATPLAQANEVAKQIFRLRETRTYLLSGEVEHAPADGKAMKLVLDELDKQEKALTDLFLGKISIRKEHKELRFDPVENAPIWFFSEENGFTDAENIDADTIRVSVEVHPQTLKPADPNNKKKKSADLSPIVYNLPGSADIKVLFDGRLLGERTLPVAQLGVDVPLSKDLFTGSQLPVIIFNEITGNILSITK